MPKFIAHAVDISGTALARYDLAVEAQQVVPGQTETADRCVGFQTTMRAVPIVAVKPVWQLGGSLP